MSSRPLSFRITNVFGSFVRLLFRSRVGFKSRMRYQLMSAESSIAVIPSNDFRSAIPVPTIEALPKREPLAPPQRGEGDTKRSEVRVRGESKPREKALIRLRHLLRVRGEKDSRANTFARNQTVSGPLIGELPIRELVIYNVGMTSSVTELKARCLAIIRQLERDGESVEIVRRGEVVARLLTAAGSSGVRPWEALRGSGELLAPAGESVFDDHDFQALR